MALNERGSLHISYSQSIHPSLVYLTPSLTSFLHKMNSNDAFWLRNQSALRLLATASAAAADDDEETSSDYFNPVPLRDPRPEPPLPNDAFLMELSIQPSSLARPAESVAPLATSILLVNATTSTSTAVTSSTNKFAAPSVPRRVSQASMSRLNNAKRLFDDVRLEWQAKPGLKVGRPNHIPLLALDCCLVTRCHQELSRYVKQHDGWSVEKRVATRKEMEAAGFQLLKRSKYFVHVVYTKPFVLPDVSTFVPPQRSRVLTESTNMNNTALASTVLAHGLLAVSKTSDFSEQSPAPTANAIDAGSSDWLRYGDLVNFTVASDVVRVGIVLIQQDDEVVDVTTGRGEQFTLNIADLTLVQRRTWS